MNLIHVQVYLRGGTYLPLVLRPAEATALHSRYIKGELALSPMPVTGFTADNNATYVFDGSDVAALLLIPVTYENGQARPTHQPLLQHTPRGYLSGN